MKETKFRAWDKNNKKMVTVDHLSFFKVPSNNGTCCGSCWYEYISDSGGTYPDNFEIMQYTGNKDVNGKEIYEGDILKINRDDDSMESGLTTVRFVEGAFIVEDDFGDYDITSIGWAIQQWNNSGDTCEVIGNIYENPDMEK
jgi:uncharacterized phage protein (TIGR01671 family)